MDKQEKCIA